MTKGECSLALFKAWQGENPYMPISHEVANRICAEADEFKAFVDEYQKAILDKGPFPWAEPGQWVEANPTEEELVSLFRKKKMGFKVRLEAPQDPMMDRIFKDYIMPGMVADMKDRAQFAQEAKWYLPGPIQMGEPEPDRISQAVDKLRKEITEEIAKQAEAAFGCLGTCQHLKDLEARIEALTEIVKGIYNRTRDEAKD